MIRDIGGLPEPDREALQHSAQLKAFIAADIKAHGGWIPFAKMMEHLLYAPGRGYYAAGATKFGAAGDFVTAPSMSPAFAKTLARAVVQSDAVGGPLTILEPGAGTGALAAQLLRHWHSAGVAVARYLILEPSPHLQAVQAETLTAQVPELLSQVAWVSDVPEGFEGTVLANEVLDAMPIHLFVRGRMGWLERGVSLDASGSFDWKDQDLGPILPRETFTAFENLPEGYLLELGLSAQAWIRHLGARMLRGTVLLIDYGFPAREFYHPSRAMGTLMCHYRHFAHADPFYCPGLQDVTAHVDFTAIGRCLMESGFGLKGYATQAEFLLNHGLLESLVDLGEPGSVRWLAASTALQKLVSPAEMGELFKVIWAQKEARPTHAERVLAQLGIEHD